MYAEKNVAALKAICKERGIKGYSSLRKPGLIETLEAWDRDNVPKAEDVPEAAPIVVKGRSVGATTMAAAAAAVIREPFTKYRSTTARNKAKANRRAIRASGGVAGWS